MVSFQQRNDFSCAELQKKMIHETELALLHGVTHSPSVPRIPTVVVGAGQFDAAYARQWWHHVLALKSTAGCPNSDDN